MSSLDSLWQFIVSFSLVAAVDNKGDATTQVTVSGQGGQQPIDNPANDDYLEMTDTFVEAYEATRHDAPIKPLKLGDGASSSNQKLKRHIIYSFLASIRPSNNSVLEKNYVKKY